MQKNIQAMAVPKMITMPSRRKLAVTNMFFCREIPFLRILTELRLTSQLSSKTAIATRSPAKDSPPGLQIEARTQSIEEQTGYHQKQTGNDHDLRQQPGNTEIVGSF